MGRPKKIVVKTDDTETKIEINTPVAVEEKPEFYNGKKIVSSKDVEINGKSYKEITIEDGSTYVI